MDQELVDAAELAARVIQNELMAQAPSEKIAKGLTVVPIYSENDVDFEIVLDDSVKYGIFLDSGTLAEKVVDPDAEWDPNPGKGKGGIKPRYWTNLEESMQVRIDMILEEALEKIQERKLDKEFENT